MLRTFNTCDPRMHPNDGRAVGSFIVQALKGDPITIYGDSQQTRSFCYVDGLIAAMVRVMKTPAEVTGLVNTGNPGEFTMLQLAALVIRLTGNKSSLRHPPLPAGDPRQRKPDISLTRATLLREPEGTLDDGLRETIAYSRPLLAES